MKILKDQTTQTDTRAVRIMKHTCGYPSRSRECSIWQIILYIYIYTYMYIYIILYIFIYYIYYIYYKCIYIIYILHIYIIFVLYIYIYIYIYVCVFILFTFMYRKGLMKHLGPFSRWLFEFMYLGSCEVTFFNGTVIFAFLHFLSVVYSSLSCGRRSS